MLKYTVYSDSAPAQSGLSALDVAYIILGHDGHDYDLRLESGLWQLYVSRYSANSYGGNGGLHPARCVGGLIYSNEDTESEAWQDVALQVIAVDWPAVPSVMTDESYQALITELNSEESES